MLWAFFFFLGGKAGIDGRPERMSIFNWWKKILPITTVLVYLACLSIFPFCSISLSLLSFRHGGIQVLTRVVEDTYLYSVLPQLVVSHNLCNKSQHDHLFYAAKNRFNYNHPFPVSFSFRYFFFGRFHMVVTQHSVSDRFDGRSCQVFCAVGLRTNGGVMNERRQS